MTASMSLEQPIEGLWATPGSPLPFGPKVSIQAFLLEREEENVIVYNAPGLGTVATEIRNRGGASKLLINHRHDGMFGAPPIDAPVFVHERDRAELGGAIPVAGTFTRREMIGADLEVIPIPGHTPGGAAYLWDSGAHRFLFTGDTVWLDHGEWSAVVLDPGARPDYGQRSRADARAGLRCPRPVGSHAGRAVPRQGDPARGPGTPRGNHQARRGR